MTRTRSHAATGASRWPMALLVGMTCLAGFLAAAPARAVQLLSPFELVDTSTAGAQGNGHSYWGGGPAERYVSANGRYVVFESEATNLVSGDTNARPDVFLRDRLLRLTERVSVGTGGTQANGASLLGVVSGDGRYVAFQSLASDLVPGDTNASYDVFVRDRASNTTERISVSTADLQSNCNSARPSITPDGRYVAFDSCAYNWPITPGKIQGITDIFLRDRVAGTTTLVSTHLPGPFPWDHHSDRPSISPDGRFVAFASRSNTLAPKGGNGASSSEIYVRDLVSGSTEWVSVHAPVPFENIDSFEPQISADGNSVAFHSMTSSLVPGDTNGEDDVFVRDRAAGTTERVSVTGDGSQGDTIGLSTCRTGSRHASMSGDGRFVVFRSCFTNLVPGDTNILADVFVRDRTARTTQKITVRTDGSQTNDSSDTPAIGLDGTAVAFTTGASNLVSPDVNYLDVFARGLIRPDNHAPTFASPDCGTVRPINNGGTVQFTVQATDPDPGIGITLAASGVPAGATMSPALPLRDSPPVTSTFTWTPTVDQGGLAAIAFTATDEFGAAATCTVTIDVRILMMTGRAVAVDGPLTLVDTGDVSSARPVERDEAGAPISMPPVSATGLSARLRITAGNAVAEAAVAEATIAGERSVAVRGVSAVSRSSCSGSAGSTTIAYLQIGATTLVDLTPEPNTVLPLAGGGSIVLNEQITDAGGGMTVRALRILLPGGTDVIISSARSGVEECV